MKRKRLNLKKVKISNLMQFSIKGGSEEETILRTECGYSEGCYLSQIMLECTSTNPVSNPRGESKVDA